jgi:hypothetical protein
VTLYFFFRDICFFLRLQKKVRIYVRAPGEAHTHSLYILLAVIVSTLSELKFVTIRSAIADEVVYRKDKFGIGKQS